MPQDAHKRLRSLPGSKAEVHRDCWQRSRERQLRRKEWRLTICQPRQSCGTFFPIAESVTICEMRAARVSGRFAVKSQRSTLRR